MEWGFNSPLAHDETADPLWICGFCFPWLWLRCCRSCFLGLQDTTCCCVFGPCLISGCCVGTGVRFPPISTTRSRLSRGVVVAPRATGRPGAGGPGRCVCRWAAVFLLVVCCPDRSPAAARPARPLAVRAASFARRVVSKPGQAPQASRRPPIGRGVCVLPGQAPPPPTGPAARPCRRSSHRRGLGLLLGSFACNSLTPAFRGSMKCPEFQRLHAET